MPIRQVDGTNLLEVIDGNTGIQLAAVRGDTLTLRERAAAPSNTATAADIYCKAIAGVTEMFFLRNDGTEAQMSGGGGAPIGGGWSYASPNITLNTSTDVVGIGAAPVASRKLTVATTGANQGIRATLGASGDNVLEALVSGDANARWQMIGTELKAGGGGASALDTGIKRSAAGTFALTDAGAGSGSLVPNADGSGTLGTAALRFSTLAGNQYNVFGAASDANPTARLLTAALRLGAGGGSAVDVGLERQAAGTFKLTDAGAGTGSLVPAVDANGNVGTATLRFSAANANQHNVFAASADANPTTRVQTAALLMGAGGASALDAGLERQAAATLRLSDGGAGSGSLVPKADGSGTLGSAALRFASANANQHNVFAAASDANPTLRAQTAALLLGAGGGSALDAGLERQAAAVLRLSDGGAGSGSLVPKVDGSGTLGTSALRFASVETGTTGHRVFAAASDANPTSVLGSAAVTLGAGGASAVDLRLRRTAAAQLTLDNGGTGAADLVPAADNQGNLGTDALRFAKVRAAVVQSGDYVFENAWRLVEDYKMPGYRKPRGKKGTFSRGGVALLRPDDTVAALWV